MKRDRKSAYYKAYGKWLWPMRKRTPLWLKLSLAGMAALLLLGGCFIVKYKRELKKKAEKLAGLNDKLKKESDRRRNAEDILYITGKNK